MHNIARALKDKGYNISGSDDEIFSPSKERLIESNIHPEKLGWYPEKINLKLDAIILGMHAKLDNPELIKAKQLNIPIYSYPEYIFEQSKNKKRIVIGGSHGKTTITSMIIHVLQQLKINCDYMVGAQLEGFNNMVKLSDNSELIILEGDEYLSSPLDKRPKFHWYKPHIAVLSGIAWDHINVFPTFNNYVEQFRKFKEMVSESLIYFKNDPELIKITKGKSKCKLIPYSTIDHNITHGFTYINETKLSFFGEHNLQNLNAALIVCQEIGITRDVFLKNISNFKGAKNRLEIVKRKKNCAIYKDFAHSPSKVKATTISMKKQFPERKLVACLELHTYSSLNKKFMPQYCKSLDYADIAIVYYNPKAISLKKIKELKNSEIQEGFNKKSLLIFNDSNELEKFIRSIACENQNLLMMSSGNFDNIKIENLI